jgi:hypothetical protein
LRSAHQILSTLLPDQPKFLQGLDEILQQLEFGLPAAALLLARGSVPLTRGQCLALLAAGVRNSDEMSDDRLRECVGSVTAALFRPAKAAPH